MFRRFAPRLGQSFLATLLLLLARIEMTFDIRRPLRCYQCQSVAHVSELPRPKCEDFWQWLPADREDFRFDCPASSGHFCVKITVVSELERQWTTRRGCHSGDTDDGTRLVEGCLRRRTTGQQTILSCFCATNLCNGVRTNVGSWPAVLALLAVCLLASIFLRRTDF